MQVSVEATSPIERQMTVTVPASRIEEDVNSRLQQTARSARIDGFRPGKVPLKVIKRRYGRGVRQEVLGELIQNTFYDAVTKENLKPAGGPAIEAKKDAEGEDFEYVATFEVYPEITLTDLAGVEIEKQVAEVAEADVEAMIETLRKQHSDWVEVDRAAEDGDQVNIDFEGFKNGEPFEGGKAQGHDLVLGSNTMIPGFESGLVGVKPGEEKEIEVTFPENYQSEELAGQPVTFKLKVNTVQAPALPELNGEFFAKFGIEETELESFKAEIRKNMEREVKQALRSKLKSKVLDELVKVNSVEVPKALIEGEVDRLRQQAVQQFGGGAQIDPNTLPAELFAEQAKQRVSVGLLVGELIQSKEIKADADRVRTTVEEMAQTYQQPQEVIDYYYSNEEHLAQVEALVLEEQVVDQLLEGATVTEVSVSYEEAIKPASAQQQEADASEEKGADAE